MDGDLLVPPDAERPDGVPGLGEDGLLSGQRLQHLCGPGEPIAGLSDADVEAELLDAHLPHRVLLLLLGGLRHAETKDADGVTAGIG